MTISTQRGPVVDEGRDQPQETMSIGTVLGFVTEFNTNTQIFNATTVLLLLGLAKMKAIEQIAAKHAQEIGVHSLAIAGIRSDIAGLKREIGGLSGRGDGGKDDGGKGGGGKGGGSAVQESNRWNIGGGKMKQEPG